MKRKNYLAPIMLVISILAVVGGGILLRRMSISRVNDERKQQLEELTVQVSDTFGSALAYGRACVGSVANLFASGEYASADDILKEISWIDQNFFMEEAEEEEEEDVSLFLLVDEDGVCYDKDGTNGVWGDFDQIAGMDEYATFIADSVNYDGARWAFVRKLDTPVTTQDGKVTIPYVALLKTVDFMSRYYASEAYADVCETYILNENGTRMYDSVSEEDTISSYNIYKALRESDSSYGGSFDEILESLSENSVASGNYESGGTEYCYSLAWQEKYGFVLLFLIPTSEVAVNTVAMVSSMLIVFVAFGALLLILVLVSAFAFMRLGNSRRIAQIREQNLKESREANERLADLNTSLIQAHRDVKSALDIAKSANRAKSSFLSNMSHDIRTPLNAIIGFLKLLERDADNPAQVRLYTEKIQISSRHLLNLINDILDMSRIESGKTTLNNDCFLMEELIEELRTVITPQANARRQQFTIEDNGTGRLRIRSDRLRLTQVLMNLLSNAVKYTPQGGSISFQVEQVGAPSKQIVKLKFIVRDTGVGMSEEFQKRVFEPFEREQNSTTSGIQGTGLGLAITKNLVDLMGGIIFVDSNPGEGSTFTVELSFPLASELEEKQFRALSASDSEAKLEENVLKDRHFLVAEDNDINAEIIRELLAMEGATCEIAVNGEEAVKLFDGSAPGSFDAIFMDIQMPIMGGYEATQKIRALGRADAQTIPIAAMTANAFAEDVQKALSAGMNAHIPKPVDMKKIKEFIAGELARMAEE